MRITDRGLALIKLFEGFSAIPYRCPAGYLTIGYGHVMQPGDRASITKQEAEQILRADVWVAEQAVARLITNKVNNNQYDALASFVFNLGSGALQHSTLRFCVNRGDHAQAAEQFMRWVYGGGKKLQGLVFRRNAEKNLYLAV